MYLKVEKGWHSTYNWSWKSQMFTRKSRGKGQLSKKDWGGGTGNSGSASQQNFPLASQAPSPFLSTHGCIIWERVTELKILDISKQSIRGRSWFSISPALDMITTNMGGVLLFTWLTECCRKRKKKKAAAMWILQGYLKLLFSFKAFSQPQVALLKCSP